METVEQNVLYVLSSVRQLGDAIHTAIYANRGGIPHQVVLDSLGDKAEAVLGILSACHAVLSPIPAAPDPPAEEPEEAQEEDVLDAEEAGSQDDSTDTATEVTQDDATQEPPR